MNIKVENATSKQKMRMHCQGRKCYTKVTVESNIKVENVIKVENDATSTQKMQLECVSFSARKNKNGENTEVTKFIVRQVIQYLEREIAAQK